MNVTIKTIPHAEQRYETWGDWYYDADGNLEIRVSECGDWRLEALTGLHELVEALACRKSGISEGAVTAFDIKFEAKRERGEVARDAEPGEADDSPYMRQHALAGAVEYFMATCLFDGLNEYMRALEEME